MDYENANKALDKARAKNRDVLQAETTQQLCCHKFEKISESAKQGEAEPVRSGSGVSASARWL